MTSFAGFAHAHGLLIQRLEDDGRIHRVPTEEKPRRRNGTYRLLGDGSWGWVCNFNRDGHAVVWKPERSDIRPRMAPSVDRGALLAVERAERARAAQLAAQILAGCQFMSHPYLVRKGFARTGGLVVGPVTITSSNGRPIVLEGRLAVPMRWFRDTRQLRSIQFIGEDGSKLFLPGGEAQEAVHVIGPSNAAETWLCEGLATALSVQAALDVMHRPARVMVCFSANTLARVGAQLDGRVFVVADHDRVNPKTGLRAGEEAARAAGKPWVAPPLEGDDANDLYVREGVYALANLLRGVF